MIRHTAVETAGDTVGRLGAEHKREGARISVTDETKKRERESNEAATQLTHVPTSHRAHPTKQIKPTSHVTVTMKMKTNQIRDDEDDKSTGEGGGRRKTGNDQPSPL